MSPEDKPRPAFTQVVDFTSKAQNERRQQLAKSAFQEPDPPLPDAELNALPVTIADAAAAAGWTSLMQVQQKSIPYILDRRDLIVQSRTGSGKTGAFLLPLFELIDPDLRQPQALMLCPTRELARQIHEEFSHMQVEGEEEFRSALIYGGMRYGKQFADLKAGAQVIIGTPGRILDHLDRGSLNLDELQLLVLDEADEMLSMGFYPAMRDLKRYLPRERNSYMFSATMPPKVRSLAREFLDDPGFLSLSTGQVGVDAIEHRYYECPPMEKDRVLARIVEMENPDSAIIFANTKRDVEYVARFLKNSGYDASEITGDLAQRERERVMKRIREGTLRFLVATDVAARGIDISDLSHVFMYDVPIDPEYYVHRSGRTARAGKTGTNIVLITQTDKNLLLRITRKYDIKATQHDPPTPEQVQERVAERSIVMLEERLRRTTNLEKERLQQFIPLIEQLAAEEPELLAMLVDEQYRRAQNTTPESPDGGDEQVDRPRGERQDRNRGGGGRKGGGNKGRRRPPSRR